MQPVRREMRFAAAAWAMNEFGTGAPLGYVECEDGTTVIRQRTRTDMKRKEIILPVSDCSPTYLRRRPGRRDRMMATGAPEGCLSAESSSER